MMEPITEELQFLRNKRSGCVHVVMPLAPDEDAEPVRLATDQEFAEALLESWSHCTPVVCGKALHGTSNIALALGGSHTDYEWVTAFADEDLCRGCHHGLGDQANLAFMHPLPGQEESEW